MRRTMIFGSLLAFVATGSVAYAIGATTKGSGPVNAQTVVAHGALVSVPAKQKWTDVPHLSGIRICATGAVSVLVTLINGPTAANYRLELDGRSLRPGGQIVGQQSHFISLYAASGLAPGRHRIDLQWYFFNGNQVTKQYSHGAMTIIHDDPGGC